MYFVYRNFDNNDQLLYVGCTRNVSFRMKQHKSRSEWFNDSVRLTEDSYPDKSEALEAEREAIRTEKPKYNSMGVRIPKSVTGNNCLSEAQKYIEILEERFGYRTASKMAGVNLATWWRWKNERVNIPLSMVKLLSLLTDSPPSSPGFSPPQNGDEGHAEAQD